MNKLKNFFKKYWLTLCMFMGLVLLYVYATESGRANPFLFPSVDAIGKAYSTSKGIMLTNMVSSFKLMIPAILISLTVSLVMGTMLGLVKWLRDAVYPIIYAFSVVPSILLSPFVLLLAPNFVVASVFLIAYSTVWTTLFATINGVMTIDKRYFDKAATLELRGIKLMTKVILPAASPSILAGFVSSLRSTFLMLIFVEMYGTQYGMGFFVKKYSEFGLYDHTWVGFIFLVIILVIVMQTFEKLKNHMLKWTIG
ncbi:ABC-type nitrate/sulfonate/bicarbonate transport system, permease component [Clostridium aceticum]|uniref:ABC-type nitrate/sulfonate/bicarbonate transport system, permease component n=1 Tax=Clostridium aceticum TaxID=84022 RepID=A0A0D8IAH1_9CLOT|nr:ABC transporter permease subunit [Clostridium aceticum]AKL96571.1 ABC-type nitrate/sulfonate/bicarbonate transport system, permease component [Clostridium aceticum]KJF27273.1 ABC transporter permease [Clostridium aceticum]